MNTFREVFGEYNNDGYCCPGCFDQFWCNGPRKLRGYLKKYTNKKNSIYIDSAITLIFRSDLSNGIKEDAHSIYRSLNSGDLSNRQKFKMIFDLLLANYKSQISKLFNFACLKNNILALMNELRQTVGRGYFYKSYTDKLTRRKNLLMADPFIKVIIYMYIEDHGHRYVLNDIHDDLLEYIKTVEDESMKYMSTMFINAETVYNANVERNKLLNNMFKNIDNQHIIRQYPPIQCIKTIPEIVRAISSDSRIEFLIMTSILSRTSLNDIIKRLIKDFDNSIGMALMRLFDDGEQTCSICLESSLAKETEELLCGHDFHQDCLNRWLQSNNTCPICRAIGVVHV